MRTETDADRLLELLPDDGAEMLYQAAVERSGLSVPMASNAIVALVCERRAALRPGHGRTWVRRLPQMEEV